MADIVNSSPLASKNDDLSLYQTNSTPSKIKPGSSFKSIIVGKYSDKLNKLIKLKENVPTNNFTNGNLMNSNNTTPRFVTIFNNSTYNDCNMLSYSDHDFVNDMDFNVYTNKNQSNSQFNDLNNSYTTNNNLIINNTLLSPSFSSLNSSFDNNYSTPPISRSSSPLKPVFNYSSIDSTLLSSDYTSNFVKRRKFNECLTLNSIDINLNLFNSNSNFIQIDQNSSFFDIQFTPFTDERISLIKNLISKDYINQPLVDSLLVLLTKENLIIKFQILKNIISLNSNLINLNSNNLVETFWNLQFNSLALNNLIENSNLIFNTNSSTNNKAFMFYEFILVDFINLLVLMDSIASYITTNCKTETANSLESSVLLHYYNHLDLENINNVKNFAKINPLDVDFLKRFIYFLWKTEDSKICNNFRNLSNL